MTGLLDPIIVVISILFQSMVRCMPRPWDFFPDGPVCLRHRHLYYSLLTFFSRFHRVALLVFSESAFGRGIENFKRGGAARSWRACTVACVLFFFCQCELVYFCATVFLHSFWLVLVWLFWRRVCFSRARALSKVLTVR